MPTVKTSEQDVIALIITRKTAVAALGALGILERHGADAEIRMAMNEIMAALHKAEIVKPA